MFSSAHQRRATILAVLLLTACQRSGFDDWRLPDAAGLDAAGTVDTGWAGRDASADGATLRDASAADAETPVDAASSDAGSTPRWWECRWDYRKTFVVNPASVLGSHSDFPLLVSIIDADLRALSQSEGTDIAFHDGEAQLPHETELYDPETGRLIAWVKLPSLAAGQASRFHLYFGAGLTPLFNASQVWANGYVGVWHFNAAPNSFNQLIDSSGNLNHAAANEGLFNADISMGAFGPGLSFGEVDSEAFVDNAPSLAFSTALTVQVWLSLEQAGGTVYFVSKMGGVGERGWDLGMDTAEPDPPEPRFRYSTDGDTARYVTSWPALQLDSFYGFSGVFEQGTGGRFYINGALDYAEPDASTDALFDPDVGIVFGDRVDMSGDPLVGRVEEIRLSNVARSADWIATEQAMLDLPASFYEIGDLEARPNPCVDLP